MKGCPDEEPTPAATPGGNLDSAAGFMGRLGAGKIHGEAVA